MAAPGLKSWPVFPFPFPGVQRFGRIQSLVRCAALLPVYAHTPRTPCWLKNTVLTWSGILRAKQKARTGHDGGWVCHAMWRAYVHKSYRKRTINWNRNTLLGTGIYLVEILSSPDLKPSVASGIAVLCCLILFHLFLVFHILIPERILKIVHIKRQTLLKIIFFSNS